MDNLPTNRATSPAKPTDSGDVVDRLFMVMATMYGKHWLDLWEGVPMPRVKVMWRDMLKAYDYATIGRVVEHIKHHNQFPPTGPEFVKLCDQYRTYVEPPRKLSGPRSPMPESARSMLAAFKAKFGIKTSMLGE